MTTVTNIRGVTVATAEPVGFVEAATADRILGWAWSPGNTELRATIELRLGDAVVAEAVADLPRPDLAINGIGDGRHAFDIPIPPEMRPRALELRVFARAADGAAVPIGAPPAPEGVAEQINKLRSGVEALVNSQRLIHRNLQAALTNRQPATDPSAEPMAAILGRMADAQTATTEQLAAVEQFVIRLDEHLSRLSASDTTSKQNGTLFPRAALWAIGVATLALAVSIAGLVRSLAG